MFSRFQSPSLAAICMFLLAKFWWILWNLIHSQVWNQLLPASKQAQIHPVPFSFFLVRFFCMWFPCYGNFWSSIFPIVC
jgi:hypothetical protein